MKTKHVLLILTLTIFSCTKIQVVENQNKNVPEAVVEKDTLFSQVQDFPVIKDTAAFISNLQEIAKLDIYESSDVNQNQEITVFRKVEIYGSDKEYFFIEYDYKDGPGAAFPYKYQVLLTKDGRLIHVLDALRHEFIRVFKNEHPFLLTVSSTSKGNGGHEIYKMNSDSLTNVLINVDDYLIRTYDAHEDSYVNEPYEFNVDVKDVNKDGFNDISFHGNILLIQGQSKYGDFYDGETINGKTVYYSVDNPFKKIPVSFVYLYNEQTGYFKSVENYREKYGLRD